VTGVHGILGRMAMGGAAIATVFGIGLSSTVAGAQALPPAQPVSGSPAGGTGGVKAGAQAAAPAVGMPKVVNPPKRATKFSRFPALPPGSGTGRRIVYANRAQRVWLVEANGQVVKSHRVSGRIGSPPPGTYAVYSKSRFTSSSLNPSIRWGYMVRFYRTRRGNNIGFHEIPRGPGGRLQTDAQLGQALSSGCVRQSTPDAIYLWNWAPVGTRVVVTP
jgi:lipoprotein-anchoring transpeptidase ErfK/SrfK